MTMKKDNELLNSLDDELGNDSEFNKFAHTLYQEPEPDDEGIPMIGDVQFKEPGPDAYDCSGQDSTKLDEVGQWNVVTPPDFNRLPLQGNLFGVGIDPYQPESTPTGVTVVRRQTGDEFVTEYLGRADDKHKIYSEDLLQALVNYNVPILHEKTRLYLGIDPGKSGGIVALKPDGTVVDKFIMPILGDNLDVAKMYDLFKDLHERYHITVILEDVHSIFGMSAATNFVFGYVCGAIEAVVLCLKLKMVKVAPKTWQKEIWINSDKVYKPKKPEQKNPSIDTKPTSICAAARLFPREDLRGEIIIKYYADSAANRKAGKANKEIPSAKKEPHDGIVDALLMAEFGRRKNL